jgi:hypothetical protein
MQLSLELEKATAQLESMGERWLILMEKQEAES